MACAVFQPTRSRGARRGLHRRTPPCSPSFQPTRSRGARHDFAARWLRTKLKVSTHALTRSATPIRACMLSPSTWFQPTRSRGARPAHERTDHDHSSSFNPRASRGARPGQSLARRFWRVSTHALTRSATSCTRPFAPTSPCAFQPTRSRGARDFPGREVLARPQFQPTRSRGARHWHPALPWPPPGGFNPRAHAERDRTLCTPCG